MRTYGEVVRSRLKNAALAAGVPDDLPADASMLPVSSVIRHARRCGVSLSDILDEPLGLDCDL